jgi:hypothetical protein
MKHPAAVLQGLLDDLYPHRLVRRAQCQANQPRPVAGKDETPAVVEGHGDPGALAALRRAQELDLEPRDDAERRDGRRLAAAVGVGVSIRSGGEESEEEGEGRKG